MTPGAAAMRDRRITFVCNPHFSLAGSAYLRGFQLAQLAARRFSSVRVQRLGELDLEACDEVVIFNKSCLNGSAADHVLGALPALRRRNVCIADPLDAGLPDALLSQFDGAMAASFGHFEALSARLSLPVFLIHHHVDCRLPSPMAVLGRARAAYFGELVNTRHAETLAERVDFVAVDTSNALDVSWMRHLPYYNLHYCLRRSRAIDGFKPATKVFVAAAMGALAIVERSNAEASRLLPADYPFYVESSDLAHVREVVDRALGSFGGDDWRHAQEAMAGIHCYREEPILDALVHMVGAVSSYEAASGMSAGRRSVSIAT